MSGPTVANYTFGFTLSDDQSGTGVTSVIGLAFGSESTTQKPSPLNRQFEQVDRSYMQIKFSPRESGPRRAALEMRNSLDGKGFNILLQLIPEPVPPPPPPPTIDNSNSNSGTDNGGSEI
jgi:hypothetical protein